MSLSYRLSCRHWRTLLPSRPFRPPLPPPTSPLRRRWRRGRVFLGTVLAAGGALVTTNSAINVPESPGPIYKFEDDEFLEYNPDLIRQHWDQRPMQVLQRTFQIGILFTPFLTKLVFWEYLIRGKIRNHHGLQRKYAIRLREILTELGPCFIKLGQALSIRPDLLPYPVVSELQKLCDSVPSFPTEEALKVIAEELQRNPGEVFFDLDSSTQPVAAASLGQVYKLKLVGTWSRSSKTVAVKVQRPDMRESIQRDLYILRRLAQVAETVKKVVLNHKPYDVALIDHFAKATILELDYLNEAKNQEFFKKELRKTMKDKIYVPKVYHDLTTRKVLVSEWIDGEKLAQSPKSVINRLTPVGVECFLRQLLEFGYFHADPHPGNLLVTTDGKLALIDFGLCASVPLPNTRTLTLAIVHIMQGDMAALIHDAVDLGFLAEETNVDGLKPELQKIYDNAQLAVLEEKGHGKYTSVVKRRKKFMSVSIELNMLFFEFPFMIPDYFALITRAMVVLEGIAVTGNPDFDLFTSAYPYALRRAISLFGIKEVAGIVKEAVANGIIDLKLL